MMNGNRALEALAVVLALLLCFLAGWTSHRCRVRHDRVIGEDAMVPLYFWNYGPLPQSNSTRRAAGLVVDFLDTRNPNALGEAQALLADLASEPVGTAAPGILWLCNYFAAPPEGQRAMLQNGDGARLLSYVSSQGFTPLRDALDNLRTGRDQDPDARRRWPAAEMAFDLLTAGGPTRAQWDAADAVVRATGLRPGSVVADLNAQTGFFAYRFARVVGPQGTVYAAATWKPELDFVQATARQEGLSNLRTVQAQGSDVPLPPSSIDCAFVCSRFNYIYGALSLAERAAWVERVKRALRPHGRLIVVDNVPQVNGAPPFIGSRISPYVVIADLESRGFVLEESYQFTPQRYVLCFTRGPS